MLLFIFRYQLLIIPIYLYYITYIKAKQYKYAFIPFILLLCIYPILSNLDMFSSSVTETFRENSSGASIGAKIEYLRNNVYILSFFSILIRTFQTLFEPILSFINNPSFYEKGNLSIYSLQQFLSNIIMLFYIKKFIFNSFFIIKNKSKIKTDVKTMYFLVIFLVILIGGTSFIHARYLYPFFPAIIILSFIPKKMMIKGMKL